MKHSVTPMFVLAALFGLAIPAGGLQAQDPGSCPAVEESEAPPIELRIGDFVLRAQVSSDRAETDGTRVEGRLIGCEREQRIGEEGADPVSVLRVLQDLRVAFQFTPEADGCIRAEVDVEDAARPADGPDRPLTLQLCGLPLP